jgi:UDP-2,3-diacylglucosamine hydrolase
MENKKIYFLSDFHLGAPDHASSLTREKRICRFLDEITPDIGQLFLLGDMFDFWYEYKDVVPRGYTRIFGKLAQLTDMGIPVHFFVGNHDMWMKSYFQQELNISVYYEPKAFDLLGKKFLIGHGDGLGPGDKGYKFIKRVFRNPVCQGLFGMLHPHIGIGVANHFSQMSREAAKKKLPASEEWKEEHFLGADKEWILLHCKEVLKEEYFDYFIFGHRHLPIDFQMDEHSRYINTGDWIRYNSYGVFDGQSMKLQYYTP